MPIFGRSRQPNPANAGMEYFNQIPGAAREHLGPYEGDREDAYNRAGGTFDQLYNNYGDQNQSVYERPGINYNESPEEYSRMGRNPTQFLDQIMRSYRPSEGYRFREGRLLGAQRNSAAAGGFAGTHSDQERQAEIANGLLGEDMQQYLQNVLGIQGAGLSGEERRIGRFQRGTESNLAGRENARLTNQAGRGQSLYGRAGLEQGRMNNAFNAATEMARNRSQNLSQQGALAFQGQRQQNENRQSRRNSIFRLLTQGGGMALGGLFGGLPGARLGAQFGGIFGDGNRNQGGNPDDNYY